MDWKQFLADNNINFVSFGPNTKRGNISVQCPWCGSDDPSQHLGIDLETGFWGCLRNAVHRGKSPIKLIQGLLGCSNHQASLIWQQHDQADPDTLEQALAMLEPEPVKKKVITPDFHLSEFKAILPSGITGRFYDYLINRGFDSVGTLTSVYKLRCAVTGRFKDRVIIPIYRQGKLIAVTARAITPVISAPRYLTSSEAIKDTILNEDSTLLGGKVLFVTEGPFDALKVEYYGYDLGANATCIFGTSFSLTQMSLLKQAAKAYKRVVLLLDPDAVEQTFSLSEWLPCAEIGQLPARVKDPGDLSKDQVKTLVRHFL